MKEEGGQIDPPEKNYPQKAQLRSYERMETQNGWIEC